MRFITSVVLALLVATGAATAQQFGDYTDHTERLAEPAGTVAAALIDALNANDPAVFERFLETHANEGFRGIPMEQHRSVYRDVWDQTHGLDYYGYRTYDPPREANEHIVIARDRLTGGWHGIMIWLDGDGLVEGLQFLPARQPSDLPPLPALTIETAVTELDAFIDAMAEADLFSGTVLVARDGEPVYERAVGLASKRFGVPNDMDTRFNLGSMNKMVTAVAIAQLVESGDLSWDDTIDAYVDDTWLPTDITSKIRIRHLLNHTSGLGSYFNQTFFESSRTRFRVVDDYKPLIRTETLAFEPGTGWAYSNTGFFLLGVVIESVTGQSYFDVVRERIFEPAGMTRTDSYEMDSPVDNLAIGYSADVDDTGTRVWHNNLYQHVIKGGPAGGGFSTAPDLMRFDRALRDGRLVSEATRTELWTPRPDANSPEYGYGFAINAGPGGRVVGHGGGFPGISSQLDMHLDTGYTVVVLSNYSRAASRVTDQISTLLDRVE